MTEPAGRGVRARRAAVKLAWLALAVICSPGPAAARTELAVTVDDLPVHGTLPPGLSRLAIATRVIDALRKHAAPGVYGFVNGGQLAGAPELEAILRAWRQAGFLLGNHTFSHLDLARVEVAEYLADIEKNQEFIGRFGLVGPRKYFRYPYLHEGGAHGKRDRVRQWLAERGYTIAPVTIDFDDWAWNEAYARCLALDDWTEVGRLKDTFMQAAMARLAWSRSASRLLFGRPIKHILLVHLGAFDALVLDDLLAAYRAAGITLVGLDAAMEDPVYRPHPDPAWDGDRPLLRRLDGAASVEVPPEAPIPLPELDRLCR